MKNIVRLGLLGLFVATPYQLGAEEPSDRQTVYVAEFASDSNVEPRLLNGITDDLESLVSAANRYTLLERRRYGALLSEVRNEASLSGRPTLVDRLKNLNAKAVFFGRVEEDVADGSYVFYLTLVKLDREVVWKREESLRHGLINDRDSRKTVLKKILGGPSTTEPISGTGQTSRQPLSPGAPAGAGDRGATASPNPRRSADEAPRANGFSLEAIDCRHEGAGVRCRMTVRNSGPARALSFVSSRTRLRNERNVEYPPIFLQLADRSRNAGGVSAPLERDSVADLEVAFDAPRTLAVGTVTLNFSAVPSGTFFIQIAGVPIR